MYLSAILFLLCVFKHSVGLNYNIYAFAGLGTLGPSTGGKASSAVFNGPRSIWQDTMSNFYVIETSGNCLRKIDSSTFIVSNFAGICGSAAVVAGDNGLATSATMNTPIGLFIDSTSTHYICDFGGHRIRSIATNNIISTIVGTGAASSLGNNGKATAATVNGPCGVWGNTVGYIAFVEYNSNYARTVTTSNIVSLIAGTGAASYSGDGGQSTNAALNGPQRIHGTTAGNIYISDCNTNRLRNVATNGIITTYIGNGSPTFNNDGQSGTSTAIYFPSGIFLSLSGDLYIPELLGQRVRVRSASTGLMSTFAGTGVASIVVTDPCGNGGDVLSASFGDPEALIIDSAGKVYMSEFVGYKVRVMYSVSPTSQPSSSPTGQPSRQPSTQPTRQPSLQPSCQPSAIPTHPTAQPSGQPTNQPSRQPSTQPSARPSIQPSSEPTCQPTIQPSVQPSVQPNRRPSSQPSMQPTAQPSRRPSEQPSSQPSRQPITGPSGQPTRQPSVQPTCQPSAQPFSRPSTQPTMQPTTQPSCQPNSRPSNKPTRQPSSRPSEQPTIQPSAQPSSQPLAHPSVQPTDQPTMQPSVQPIGRPSSRPSRQPSRQPTMQPIHYPSSRPSAQPSHQPSSQPFSHPSWTPSEQPNASPTSCPSRSPSARPSKQPSLQPSRQPSEQPTSQPSHQPFSHPSATPSSQPSSTPSVSPSCWPSSQPSHQPVDKPSKQPSGQPAGHPSSRPSSQPLSRPSTQPSVSPTSQPSSQPTSQPSRQPVCVPSRQPTRQPISHPSVQPSVQPTRQPSRQPSAQPSAHPTSQPFSKPSRQPSNQPTDQPTRQPSEQPSTKPSLMPTSQPSCQPVAHPSAQPSRQPSSQPSSIPTIVPTHSPTVFPSAIPTIQPSSHPSKQPTTLPSDGPSVQPSSQPSAQPMSCPSAVPTEQPSVHPSHQPSIQPTSQPSAQPFSVPSTQPSKQPLAHPSSQPPRRPSEQPTAKPTAYHTRQPTSQSEQVRYYDLLSVNAAGSDSFEDRVKIVLPFSVSRTGVVSDGYKSIDLPSPSMTGNNFVVFGQTLSDTNLTASIAPAIGYLVKYAVGYDFSSRSVSSLGDVNGDGFNDLIIGVPYASRCYVMFGNAGGYVNMSLGFMVHGASSVDLTGWSVSDAGDVNNDTFADILVGAPRATFGSLRSGAAYVLYGSDRVFRDVYLDDLSPEEGFVMYGEGNEDCFGLSVAGAGDVNGDAVDDVVVGALKISSFYTGGAYIVFGGVMPLITSPSMKSVIVTAGNMSAIEGVSLIGDAWSHSGCSVSGVGDVNDDGFDDVLIGSVPLRSNTRSIEVSYLVHGFNSTKSNVTSLRLSSESAKIVGGGVFVGGVSDVNHDGVRDLLVGSNYSQSAGVGYVILYPLLKYAPTAQPSIAPSAAPSTASPSVKPFRTVSPSLAPVVSPSVDPTRSPTRPTVSPSAAPSGPSQCPTSRPSHFTEHPSSRPSVQPSSEPSHTASPLSPTSYPTLRTELPTTAAPTESPSEVPSVGPSLPPSQPPSVSPSTVGPTEFPTLVPRVFSRPTMQPTFTVTRHIYSNISVILDGSGGSSGEVNRTVYSLRGDYLWSAAVDVSLLGKGSRDGDVIRVMPNADCRLVVQYFNESVDVIDLTAFPQYSAKSDLNITKGSVIVTLPNNQIIKLQNLNPEDVRNKNFRFLSEENVIHQDSNYRWVVVGCVCFGLLMLIATSVYRYYFLLAKWAKIKKIADDLIARQVPLVTHTHSLYRNTLIGRLRENDSDDSLIEHVTDGSEYDSSLMDSFNDNEEEEDYLEQEFPRDYEEDFELYLQQLQDTDSEEEKDLEAKSGGTNYQWEEPV